MWRIKEGCSGPIEQHHIAGLAMMFGPGCTFSVHEMGIAKEDNTKASPVWNLKIPWNDMADGDSIEAICGVMGWEFQYT